MQMEDGKIVRYVRVIAAEMFGYGGTAENGCWYIDDTDSAEVNDKVSAPFKYQEIEGTVVEVVRCVYPYVMFSNMKIKHIYEITERSI